MRDERISGFIISIDTKTIVVRPAAFGNKNFALKRSFFLPALALYCEFVRYLRRASERTGYHLFGDGQKIGRVFFAHPRVPGKAQSVTETKGNTDGRRASLGNYAVGF